MINFLKIKSWLIQNQKSKIQNQIIQNCQGFTIIECLIAIIVVGLLLTATAPVLVLSAATRVQAKRVEQATQATHSFVDGVRSGEITGPTDTVKLSSQPTDITKYNWYCYNTNGAIYTYDTTNGATNPNCTGKQFYIQAAQIIPDSTTTSTSNTNLYRLGVRVYRADFDFSQSMLISSNSTLKKTQASFTGGLGNKQAPLLEMTIDVSNDKTSFNALCQRFGGCTSATPTATATATP